MGAKVISVVSGKGGSGKSLLTAVLGRALAREGKRVLLVDMDIFVRGLTVLLFSYTRPERSGGKVTISDALGVYAEKSEETGPTIYSKESFMIERFFECDVIPSVENVALPLDYNDRSLSDEKFTNKVLNTLILTVAQDYDYILLDNRAGMDSLIASACRTSDITIAIAEDDEVGRQTNSNLTKFLQTRKEIKIVYTIINKGRNMRSYKDVKERLKQRHEYSVLGAIPFDIEVLEDFGSDRFWSTITETLYFRSLIDVWNELAKSERVQELTESKYRFPPSIFMQPSQGRFSLVERMMRLYSVLFIFSGVMMWVWQNFRSKGVDFMEMMPVVLIVAGAIALLMSISGFQSFLKGRIDEDKYRKRSE